MSEPSAVGLESGMVRVVNYDPRWPVLYAGETARLRGALATCGLTLVLEHTGSTAIPGLVAKPIVDILAGCAEDEERDPLIAAIESAGYVYRGEQGIPGRDFFRRGTPRSYHLHLTAIGSEFWRDHLTFRDRKELSPAGRADRHADVRTSERRSRSPANRPVIELPARGGRSEYITQA